LIQDKNNIKKELIPEIEELVTDGGIAEKIYQDANSSMGQDLSEDDLA